MVEGEIVNSDHHIVLVRPSWNSDFLVFPANTVSHTAIFKPSSRNQRIGNDVIDNVFP